MTHKSEFHRLKVCVERNDSLKLVIWAETNLINLFSSVGCFKNLFLKRVLSMVDLSNAFSHERFIIPTDALFFFLGADD